MLGFVATDKGGQDRGEAVRVKRETAWLAPPAAWE